MDFKGFAFEKPGKTRGPLRAEKFDWGIRHPDGREVCGDNAAGRREYRARVEAMWLRQGKRCGLGGEPMGLAEATFEHGRPRGMGAGFRDDRIDAPGNCAACGFHNGQKGSKRVLSNL